jgi:predicted N-acyltransferase
MSSSHGLPDTETVVRLHTDIVDIPRERWDSLRHPSVYLHYDWLHARSGTVRGASRFFTADTAAGDLLLAVPGYLTDRSAHPGYHPAGFLDDELPDTDIVAEPGGAQALACVRAWLASAASDRALVLGAPGRMGGVSAAPGMSAQLKRAALTDLVAAAAHHADLADAGTVGWVYLLEGVDPMLDEVLRESGYLPVVMGADCYLPILWDSFEGYLASFKSRHRVAIRHEMQVCRDAGVSFELHGPDILGPELAELELQWRRKYDRRAVYADTLADYDGLREKAGNVLHVLVARRAGCAIGFMTFLEDETTWWARFAGFDYTVAGQLYLYFNMVFYHLIERAIDRGISQIAYSTGSYEAKCSRGCSLRNLLAYVRVPDAVRGHLGLIDHIQRQRFDRIAQHYRRRAAVRTQ